MRQFPRTRSSSYRVWRVFCARDGRAIETALRQGRVPLCPCCGELLEARRESRLGHRLPLDARAFDFDCRPCRRFWSMVQHTERSLRLVRMRRFIAALRAVEPPPPGAPEPVALA